MLRMDNFGNRIDMLGNRIDENGRRIPKPTYSPEDEEIIDRIEREGERKGWIERIIDYFF